MALSDLSLSTRIKEAEERIQVPEEMLGNTLMMPFTPACSAQRKIMFAQHLNQHLNLIHGEVPLVCTGYEDEFAKVFYDNVIEVLMSTINDTSEDCIMETVDTAAIIMSKIREQEAA